MAEPGRWADIGEKGFVKGMRLLFWLYRHANGPLSLILHPVILYYFITNRTARESSKEYLSRLSASYPDRVLPTPTQRNIYKHLFSFAQSVLDKLGVWANSERFSALEFHSRQLLLDQINSSKGAVLLGAHLGNMEVCRRLSKNNTSLKLNILVHTKHANMFNKLLRELDAHHDLELIEVTEMSPATAIRLGDCIERGEFIVVLADRIPVASKGRCQAVTFLGGSAYFPEGPFILASILKCPVYSLFCTREASGYVIRCEKFAEQITLPRHARDTALATYLQQFADTLEKHILYAPLQWFNFYPFWGKPE